MILLNFSHPLSAEQLLIAESLVSSKFTSIIDIKTHLDHQTSFPLQVKKLVGDIPLTSQQWQNAKILVVPPSLSIISCILLSELHGRMGYFPAVLRVKPVPGSTPPVFEPAEVLNLQAIRDASRENR
ncbi:MAG: hypothetical protein RL553_1078 [Planctomycetota bacterium]|jgi:hypothetical protein